LLAEKHTFGDRLKREREMRGVSLDEISAATRISTRFLTALENEEWQHLPGGVFNRGFIRAVARFLGLDEEDMVAEYANSTSGLSQAAAGAQATGAPRKILPWVAAIVVLALAAGGWLGFRRYGGTALAWWNARRPTAEQQSVTNAAPAATSATASGTASTTAIPATLELKVEAGKATHLTVLADGKTIFDDQLAAGESKRFEATDQFTISAQESSAVLVELNGQTIPPLGPPDQPGTVTLTRKDLKNP
jgi:cytoskeletal protein RodZ